MMKDRKSIRFVVSTLAIWLTCCLVGVLFVSLQVTHAAAAYCQATYAVTNQWSGGFNANITIQNTSASAWTNWTLSFAFPASNQTVTQGWNGTFTQSGQQVKVVNASYNGNVAVNGTVVPGFSANSDASNPIPTSFSVNGNPCNGGSGATPTPTPGITPTPGTTPTPTPTPTPGPGSFVPVVTPTSLTLTGSHTGNATWFSALGSPYGGCGVPQANLDSQNFVAMNVQTTPGDYNTYLTRPIGAQDASKIGMFSNGLNCGRWVRVTIGDFCTGINDGAQNMPFCRNGNWITDKYNGATLDMLVADSCQDGNAWCRDDPNHLDLAQNSLNQFALNGQPVGDMYPNSWKNRQINWQFIPAPNYSGDIQIGFLQGASPYWSAISINHLANGIHGVEYYQNGSWVNASMDSDLGQDYIILPTSSGGNNYQIKVFDASNQPINNGRIYNFSYPSSCGSSCSSALVTVPYTTTQP
ncbi:cellulose binding domain-containing protein [Dictyobacter kobayashii]|uniref:CBM2 domain-containing protein n=1 Tax=Dictyobacter kobayashii TaxID=2014872 RepID=A0A402AWL6_9CHLR|nr:cellulose binding domain-containing protein [Dictyobacter kobayashii]GCE23478.1 hypothetical protein KDK_72780 [Dictyobacter kobayashii]